ncbi:MAG: hypothetical protein U0996_01105 [Planctomycetaceae bacterium]
MLLRQLELQLHQLERLLVRLELLHRELLLRQLLRVHRLQLLEVLVVRMILQQAYHSQQKLLKSRV